MLPFVLYLMLCPMGQSVHCQAKPLLRFETAAACAAVRDATKLANPRTAFATCVDSRHDHDEPAELQLRRT